MTTFLIRLVEHHDLSEAERLVDIHSDMISSRITIGRSVNKWVLRRISLGDVEQSRSEWIASATGPLTIAVSHSATED